MSDHKQLILDSVSDLVANLLYYDRKNDDELPMEAINKAVADGVISVDEIVQYFRDKLIEGLEQ